jgi:predicted TIM-barrel fold metal-dependent hydrolase
LYSGPIVDAHTHLWDLSMNKHPWLSPSDGSVQALGGLEELRRNYLVADYRRDSANQNIVASIHIEAQWDRSDPLGETQWLETLDKSGGVAIRYTAAAPFGTPQGACFIEQQAAYPRVVAIRDILSFHPTAPEKSFAARGDKAYDPAWRQDVARLPGLGLVLELMMYPHQLDAVLDVARSIPDLRLVVNHCASPLDRDEDGMLRWRDAVRHLGREPNIMLKVSNAAAYDPEPTYESVRAVVMHCIESFGSQRAIFATDWPVAGLKTSFDYIYDTLRRITADMTEAEQRALFHDNAARLYRIDGAP